MKWQNILPTGSDLGLRFNLAGILPTTFLAVFVIALSWSGAPSKPPSWTRLLASARDLKPGEAVLLFIVILLVGLLGQPLQRPLVRLLEGYWVQHPRVPAWLGIAACRGQQRRFSKLWQLASTDPPGEQDTPTGEIDRAYKSYYQLRARRPGHSDPDYQQVWRAFEIRRYRAAGARLHSRFPPPPEPPSIPEERILPTALGNTLRAAEDTAGQRYGLDSVTLWPALYTVLSPAVKEAVDDSRNQMDIAARFCAVLVGCALAAAIMLWRYPLWMIGFIAVTLLGARFAYLAAVSAAEGYGVMIGLAFDRHRFDLLTALHLPLPPDSVTEHQVNQDFTERLYGDTRIRLRYEHPAPSSDTASPAITNITDGQADSQVQDSSRLEQSNLEE
jgi:hypothetical protein